MAKEADKELKTVQDYIRKLSIVSTKGPQVNGAAEYVEEKSDPQVHILFFFFIYFILIKI